MSTILNFTALLYLPLTVTAAIAFSGPLWVCLLSIPFLGEQVGPRRWAAIVVGFCGVLIVTRPWSGAVHWAVALSIGAALGGAFYSVLTRLLAGRDSTGTQQFYAALVATIGTAPLALLDWAWPSGVASWIAFLLIGVFGWSSHQLLIIAHRFAPASTLAPFAYAQILYMGSRAGSSSASRPISGSSSGRESWWRAASTSGSASAGSPECADTKGGDPMPEPRTVLVTGASQGIGAATARAFAGAGYRVVLAARSADKLAAVVAGLGEAGAGCLPVACDVSDPDSVETLFARIRAELGRLDVVFNNAGTNIPTTLAGDVSWQDWRKVLSVNLDGAFLIAAAAFRLMREQAPQGGRIINNGSISAHAPRYGSAPYTASKHAISGLTKSLSLDGRAFDIACGQIDIGNAASDMTARMTAGVPQADGTLAPEPRIDVDHVARAVLQMAELPLDVNVQTLTIMATKMPFVGRG